MLNDIVAFVPMRSESKGIPDKNIKKINGKPLFYWAISALVQVGLPLIIVSTDSAEYAKEVKKYFSDKVEIVFRSKEASSDEASTESAVLEYLKNTKLMDSAKVLLVQLTSPLITPKDIINLIEYYSTAEVFSVVSVVDISDRFIWDGQGLPRNYDYRYRQRRQDFSSPHEKYRVENGAMYLNSMKNWLESECRLTEPVGEYCMSPSSLIEIDTEEDWKIVEKILEVKYGKS